MLSQNKIMKHTENRATLTRRKYNYTTITTLNILLELTQN